MPILLLLIQLLTAINQFNATMFASMTPAQRELYWQRQFDATEWLWKLLGKFSDRLEAQIEKDFANDPLPKTVPKVA